MRFSRGRGPDWPLEDAAVKLAGEVEAWVNGDLGEARAGRKEHGLAGWLILNRVAHADLVALRRAGREAPVRVGRRQRRWATAERDLVQQVLAAVETPEELALLQRRVLLPLEMQFVERSKAATVTLTEVQNAATTALAQLRL
jgi:hypothetical protein